MLKPGDGLPVIMRALKMYVRKDAATTCACYKLVLCSITALTNLAEYNPARSAMCCLFCNDVHVRARRQEMSCFAPVFVSSGI